MQSVHACACFRKVDQFGRKSPQEGSKETILVVLASLWAPLGRTWRTFGHTWGNLFLHVVSSPILCDFYPKTDLPDGSPRQGRSTSGDWGISHSGPWMVVLPRVYEHSARRVPAQPRGEVTFSDFSLLVSLQEPLG